MKKEKRILANWEIGKALDAIRDAHAWATQALQSTANPRHRFELQKERARLAGIAWHLQEARQWP